MLGDTNPTGVVSEQLSDLIDAEITQCTQQNNFRLILVQCAVDEVDGVLGGELLDRNLLGRGARIALDLSKGVGSSSRCSATGVDHAQPGDREEPCCEIGHATFERVESLSNREPGLAGKVVGQARLACTQITEQARLICSEQRRETSRVAALGRAQRGLLGRLLGGVTKC